MDRSVRPELHDPSFLREKSVIGSNPNKIPGRVPSPTLTDDNAARGDLLAAVGLHAQALGIGVSSVSGTSLTFCMCHVFLLKIRLSDFDLFDKQPEQILPMSLFFPG